MLLDPALRAAAKRRAHERGLSLSAYIRELIRHDDAAAAARAGDITPLIGFLGTGAEPSDIATNKHEMIQQAFSKAPDHKSSTATGPECAESSSTRAPGTGLCLTSRDGFWVLLRYIGRGWWF